jgi:hypothetical protein
MWILFKLGALLFGVLVRWVSHFSPTIFKEKDGYRFACRKRKNRNGRVTFTSVGVPLELKWVFVLTKESGVDRFFKSLGMSTEFQTGDSVFDQRVYIAGDHPHLGEVLRASQLGREGIIRLLDQAGFFRIRSDGKVLWVDFAGNKEPEDVLPSLCQVSSEVGTRARQHHAAILTDPHFWKIFLAESLAWGLAMYGVAALFDVLWHREDLHLHPWNVYSKGAAVGVVGFLLAFGILIGLLRKSSRTHRILVEGGFLLCISLPWIGVASFSDVNREFDTASSIEVVTQVQRYWEVEHRTRKGGKYWTYHIALAQTDLLPSEIRVSYDTYRKLKRPNQMIRVRVGPGALGEPWYRGYEVEEP